MNKGKPKRSDYRKFKNQDGSRDRTTTPACDEVLTRRFSHGLERDGERAGRKRICPESSEALHGFRIFCMMDGGRGQVNIALQVLDELHLKHSGLRHGKG